MTPSQFKKSRFNQIKKSADKFNIAFDYKQANTGTYYVELTSDSSTIIVRVADHADAYATAEFNCDPYDSDMIKGVKKWITDNGRRTTLTASNAQKIADKFKSNLEYEKAKAVWAIVDGLTDKQIMDDEIAIWGEDVAQEKFESFLKTINQVKLQFGVK
jgi:hypothetical protein